MALSLLRAQFQSLIRELRSHKLSGMTKKEKKKKRGKSNIWYQVSYCYLKKSKFQDLNSYLIIYLPIRKFQNRGLMLYYNAEDIVGTL